jgi:hypothetical protein
MVASLAAVISFPIRESLTKNEADRVKAKDEQGLNTETIL